MIHNFYNRKHRTKTVLLSTSPISSNLIPVHLFPLSTTRLNVFCPLLLSDLSQITPTAQWNEGGLSIFHMAELHGFSFLLLRRLILFLLILFSFLPFLRQDIGIVVVIIYPEMCVNLWTFFFPAAVSFCNWGVDWFFAWLLSQKRAEKRIRRGGEEAVESNHIVSSPFFLSDESFLLRKKKKRKGKKRPILSNVLKVYL